MHIHLLEINQSWFVVQNNKKEIRKKRIVSAWADKDSIFEALMNWIETVSHNSSWALDSDLVFAAKSIAQSDGITDWDKVTRITSLINRFSKMAAEINLKAHQMGTRYNYLNTLWAEIFTTEIKLQGSVFE